MYVLHCYSHHSRFHDRMLLKKTLSNHTPPFVSFHNESTESALQIWLAPGNTEMDVAKNMASLELLLPPNPLEQLPPLTVRHPFLITLSSILSFHTTHLCLFFP